MDLVYTDWCRPDSANVPWVHDPRKRDLSSEGRRGASSNCPSDAGWSYTSGMRGADDTGPATGPYLGVFLSVGYVMIALRGTFATFGDERDGTLSLDFGFKKPILVSGR